MADLLGRPGLYLANVEARAEKNPKFQIPSRDARRDLHLGYLVTLVFCHEPVDLQMAGERLRVQVEAVTRSPEDAIQYEGCLIDKAAYVPMQVGERFEFGPEHVYAIDRVM